MAKGNGRSDPERQKFEQDFFKIEKRLRVYALSLTRTRDAADDLVQDTFLKALAGYSSFQEGTNFAAWIFRIQRNEFISGIRRQRPGVSLDSSVGISFDDRVRLTVNPNLSIELRQIIPLLAYLAQDQLDCLLGSIVCGFSYDQLGEIFGVSVGTIKSRISRGRDALECLVEADITPEGVDVSSWKDASTRVKEDDSYFSIAKAYEELYIIWTGVVPVSSDTESRARASSFDISRVLADIKSSERFDDLHGLDELQ